MRSSRITNYIQNAVAVVALSLIACNYVNVNFPSTEAFLHPSLPRIQTTQFKSSSKITTRCNDSSLRLSSAIDIASKKNLVVISPPKGLGEITAVEAAKMGTSVRWFVISAPSSSAASPTSLTLSSASLAAISDNGGSVELVGAEADTLLLPVDEPFSSFAAVSAWCQKIGTGQSGGIVCTLDGIEDAIEMGNFKDAKAIEDARNVMIDAVKVAAREACSSVSFSDDIRVAVIPSNKDDDNNNDTSNTGENNEVQGFLGSLFGKGKVDVPFDLSTAMSGESSKFATLRYGELFGLPESSNVSPFVAGPRREPIIRDEYTMRSIRVDPTISISGNTMVGSTTRSSRLSVGEAAARMALNSIPIMDNLDVCVTSLRGMDAPSTEDWDEEFKRVQDILQSGQGAQLFSVSFASVPSIKRLSDWIAEKWAPAVMRTYDIAGIRVGARPVFATRIGEGLVEIVWQELKDFDPIFVGKMNIEVSANGITAVRGPGDAAAGYGTISRKPLPGEDILVRRLSEAATQAVEKGLATKPKPKKKVQPVKKTPVVSTVLSSGTVSPPESAPKPPSADGGPRTVGTRRSSKRKRGASRKETKDSLPESVRNEPSADGGPRTVGTRRSSKRKVGTSGKATKDSAPEPIPNNPSADGDPQIVGTRRSSKRKGETSRKETKDLPPEPIPNEPSADGGPRTVGTRTSKRKGGTSRKETGDSQDGSWE